MQVGSAHLAQGLADWGSVCPTLLKQLLHFRGWLLVQMQLGRGQATQAPAALT